MQKILIFVPPQLKHAAMADVGERIEYTDPISRPHFGNIFRSFEISNTGAAHM